MNDDKSKVAIVTGASSGIGKAIAGKLSQENWRVILVARNIKRLREAAKDIGGKCFCFPADIRRERDIQLLFRRIALNFERIDVLINNAAVQTVKEFNKMSAKDFDDIFDTNVRGAFLCTKKVLDYMVRQRSGQIINISSNPVRKRQAGTAIYSASKEAFSVLFSHLGDGLKEFGIKNAIIYPSKVATEWRLKNKNFNFQESMLLPENIADLVWLVINQGPRSNISEIFINSSTESKSGKKLAEKKMPVAVVVGGSRGIGRALALKLDRHNFSTIITGRDSQFLTSVLKDFSKKAMAISFNVKRKEDVDGLVKTVIRKFGRIDILVYCVGGGGSDSRSITQIPPDDLEEVFYSNLFGAYRLIYNFVPYFQEQGSGRIFLISSRRAKSFSSSHTAPFLAAKSALEKLAWTLYRDLMKYNIKVTTLTPSLVLAEKLRKANGKKIPPNFLNWLLTPEEAADIFWGLINQKDNVNVTQIVIGNMLSSAQSSELFTE